jgi:hypothetical protein
MPRWIDRRSQGSAGRGVQRAEAEVQSRARTDHAGNPGSGCGGRGLRSRLDREVGRAAKNERVNVRPVRTRGKLMVV